LCASSPFLFFLLGWKKEEKRRKKSAQKTNRARVRTYTEKKTNLFSLSSAACVIYTKTVLAALSLFSAERGARDTSTFLSLNNLHRAARVLRKTRVFIKEEREDDDAA